MENTIEIPKGYEARIEGNKVIFVPKESKNERIRKEILSFLKEGKPYYCPNSAKRQGWFAWLEKKGSPKMSAEALREGVTHYGITQYQIDNWLKKYVEVESTEPPKYGIWDVIRLKNSDHEFIISRITGEYYHSKGAFIEIRIADDVNGDWEYVRHIQPEPKFNVGDTIIAKPETCMEHVPFHITSIEGGFYWDGEDSILIDNQDEFVLVGKSVAPAHKFKVGDWVVFLSSNTLQIVKIDLTSNYYWFNDGSFLAIVDEDCLRPWTIEDAKDGDVLVASDNSIFILKSVVNNECICYIALSTDNSITLEDYWEVATAVHPATKEQRGLLFQKMKETGYEWDAEKMGLKKIEQNPVTEMKSAEESLGIDSKTYNKIVDECIYGEQNPAWSDEDEKCVTALLNMCCRPHDEMDGRPWDKWYERLKTFKDRIQSHWKPTTEQLIYLKAAFEKYDFCDSERGALESLYNDLKKLEG